MAGARQRTGDRVQQCTHLAVDDDCVETFLAAEVLVDDGLGDARPLGDLLDRRCVETLFREQRTADVEQLLTPLLARHAQPSVSLRIVLDAVIDPSWGSGVGRSTDPAILASGHRAARRASRRSWRGHRTSYAHPHVSNSWMTRAPEST